MSDRRYSEDEIATIFERAAEAQRTARRPVSPGDGMTLADLHEIGREVGIPAELVTQAAHSLDQDTRPAVRRFLGLPIGVGRTVELERRLTDPEWEQLVVDLRQTFDARGRVREEGAFRHWTNGNLQALLEPTPNGHRLRLQTVKGSARSLMTGGMGMVGITAAMLVGVALTGRLVDPGALTGAAFLATAGLGMFGMGAGQLPGWARRRRQQMEGVAARLVLAASSPAPSSALGPEARGSGQPESDER